MNHTNVCVLIATKNGAETLQETIEHACTQADVYVVSDGSTDKTISVAKRAGATVLGLRKNIGKPAALRRGFHKFNLSQYEFILVLDDDTRLAPDFVHEALLVYDKHDDAVAVSGKTMSDWRHGQRWNGWVAARALGYWRYNWAVKVGQSALNAITVLPGSNTVFRTDTFAALLKRDVRYIVDDTQWCLDIQTENMGRILHTSHAVAYVQDPGTLREYYKQMLRWMWGSFQGVRGHKIGRRLSWFSFTYSMLILDWVLYVLLWPAILVTVGWSAYQSDNILTFLGWYFGLYLLWCCVSGIFLRRWRLPLLMPWVVIVDWVNRVIFIHAFIKAWRQPVVESCKWESPARFNTQGGTA